MCRHLHVWPHSPTRAVSDHAPKTLKGFPIVDAVATKPAPCKNIEKNRERHSSVSLTLSNDDDAADEDRQYNFEPIVGHKDVA